MSCPPVQRQRRRRSRPERTIIVAWSATKKCANRVQIQLTSCKRRRRACIHPRQLDRRRNAGRRAGRVAIRTAVGAALACTRRLPAEPRQPVFGAASRRGGGAGGCRAVRLQPGGRFPAPPPPPPPPGGGGFPAVGP